MFARTCFLGMFLLGSSLFFCGCLDPQAAIDSIQFATCPAGAFQMGAAPGEAGSADLERPQHTVTFAEPFQIATCEITRNQWKAIMGEDPPGGMPFGTWNRPATEVSWHEAQAFVARINELRPGENYSLPTEAQWEYACRAGTTTRFYWGDDPGLTLMPAYAWVPANSGDSTHDVGEKQPNAWGIYDMAGNVWEWVADPYHADYTGAPTDGSAWEPGDEAVRGVRGAG